MTKFDRRRKYYLILDCETATLPFAQEYSGKLRDKVALARPLIYDIGWKVVDRNGNEYKRVNYLITEIFSVPQIFDTAYYADKRPLYIEKLKNGEITLASWDCVALELLEDMEAVDSVGAYNAMFDYKRAISFTEKYIRELYGNDFQAWLKMQKRICDNMDKPYKKSNREFDGDHFTFRGVTVPLFDLWGLACEHILNSDEYRKTAEENEWFSASGKYYSTNAQSAYRFISGEHDFDEAHTAIDDCDIETLIFAVIVKMTKNKWAKGIMPFPFKIVGTVPITEDMGE